MRNLILSLAVLGFLSGCVVEEHHRSRPVVVHETPVTIIKQNPAKTVVVTPHETYIYHCPPGQAKKGRC